MHNFSRNVLIVGFENNENIFIKLDNKII